MTKDYKLNQYVFILVMTVLIVSARYVSAEDCPCSPCPGGVYGCEDGCISICYLDTNQCQASCTKGESVATSPSIKFGKGITPGNVFINNVPSGSVKPILEKLFNVKLAGKPEAKTNLIKIRAENVDLSGILLALEKQGLVLRLQEASEYLSPEER